MGRLTLHLVTSHSPSRVASTSLSYGRNDGSSVRQRVEHASPTFVDLHGIVNDEDAHARVSALDLDVVVDLVGHTYKGRISIANRRPAPLVINYLGYPGSMGCEGYDYSMVDRRLVRILFYYSSFSCLTRSADLLVCSLDLCCLSAFSNTTDTNLTIFSSPSINHQSTQYSLFLLQYYRYLQRSQPCTLGRVSYSSHTATRPIACRWRSVRALRSGRGSVGRDF
jgi:hypothetical protein